jgi:hypothetical protein
MISIAAQKNLARLVMAIAPSLPQGSTFGDDMHLSYIDAMKMEFRILGNWGIMGDVNLAEIYRETIERGIAGKTTTVAEAAAAVAHQIPKDIIESWRAQMQPFALGPFSAATKAALEMLTPAWATEIEGCRATDKYMFYETVKESVDYDIGAEDIVLFQPPSAEHKETVELIMAKYLRYAKFPHLTEGIIDPMQTMPRDAYAVEWAKAWLAAV